MEGVRCSCCGEMLPATTEFFSPRNGRKRGFNSRCKSCINSKNKEVSKAKKIAKFAAITHKTCSSCNETKEIARFRKRSGRNFGWVSKCLDCEKVEKQMYREKHKEDIKLKRELMSDEIRQSNRNRYYANREHVLKKQAEYRDQNRDVVRDRVKANYYKDKSKYALASRRKELKIKFVSVDFGELSDLLISESYKLRDMRTKATGVKWHVDHIVPLQSELVQGLHCGYNLQLLPASHNIAKGNRWWPDMPEYSAQDLHELRYFKWLAENADLDKTNNL